MTVNMEINGHNTPFPEDVENLEGLLLHLMQADAAEKVITEVKLNGETFSEEFDHHARSVFFEGIENIEIMTQDKQEFARQSLAEFSDIITGFASGLRLGIEMLRDPYREENGYDLLARSLEAVRDLKSHSEHVMIVLEKASNLEATERLWLQISDVSSEIIELQQAGDSLGIADLLEAKMLPFIEQWKRELCHPKN